MKLRASLQISAVFPIVLAILVSVGLVYRSRAIDRARQEGAMGEELLKRVSALYSSTYMCLARNDAKTHQDWESRYGELENFLKQQTAKNQDRRTGVAEVLSRLQAAKGTFTTLLASRTAAAAPAEGAPAVDVRKLETDLAEQMGSMVTLSFQFARSVDEETIAMERIVDRIFIGFVAAAALALTGLTFVAGRDVVRRLRDLRHAAERVGMGDFTQKPEKVVGDALGETFQAFNEMMSRLQQSHGTLKKERDDWKKQYEKDKEAASKARQANMSLADALTKLKRVQQQVAQQERVRALEQIVRGVSRDFTSALLPVVSTSDFLLAYPEHLNDKKELTESLKSINAAARNAEKQVRLLSDVVLVSERAESEKVDANDVARKAIDLAKLRRKWISEKEEFKITCELQPADVPAVEGNEQDLVEALTHVILNSVEAMPMGGKVTVSTKASGGGVTIEVADTGEGMAEDVRQRCLEPFFSTKGMNHSGMGLTYAVAAAGRYGGSVDIKSTAGHGTSIVLTLPAWKDGKRAMSKDQRKQKLTRKLRVLVVDDEEWARKLLTKGLTLEGHTVEAVSTGAMGLKRGVEEEFDLVLLDRAMPDMTGDEVAIGIRQVRPNCPIILVTGMGDLMLKEGERPKAIDAILSKPVTMAELHKTMVTAILNRVELTKM